MERILVQYDRDTVIVPLSNKAELMERTPEQEDNLLRLADGLEKVAQEWPELFDMRHFVGFEGDNIELLDSNYKYKQHIQGQHPQECGTTACAIGWAPYLLGQPNNYGWHEYGEQVLGLDEDGFYYLFLNWGALGTSVGADAAIGVANKIRDFVANGLPS